jgi:hypothetical protein
LTAVATHPLRGRAGSRAVHRSSSQAHAHAAPVHHYAWHALEVDHCIGQKSVDVETVQEVLAPDLDGYGLRGARARREERPRCSVTAVCSSTKIVSEVTPSVGQRKLRTTAYEGVAPSAIW